MTKEREYRAYAGACVDLANKATSDEDKKHLLAMAEAWLGLADRVQRPVPEPDAFVASSASRQSLGACLRFVLSALTTPERLGALPTCAQLFSMLMPFTLPQCSRSHSADPSISFKRSV